MNGLRSFLNAINPRLLWPGLLVLLVAVPIAIVIGLIGGRWRFARPSMLIGFGVTIIVAAVIAQCAIACDYLWYPSYLDHAEAMIAATSWLGWTGSPIYPSFETGDVYGTLYGPALFQLNGLFLWLFGPSVAASKLLGFGAFVAALVVAFVVFRRNGATTLEALAITGTQCLIQSAQADQGYAFGARADPLLFLAGQIAVLVATGAPTVANAVFGGVVAGLAINLKVHAILYVLPLFVFFLSQAETAGMRLRLALIAIGAGIITSILPFLASNVSVAPYVDFFQVQLRYAILRWTFDANLAFAAMCVAPLLYLYVLFKPTLARGFVPFLGTMVICLVIAAVLGAKEGSGPHHLLPLVPSLTWAFLVMWERVRRGLVSVSERTAFGTATSAMILAFLIGYLPIVGISSGHILRDYAQAPLIEAAAVEINRDLDDNPGLRLAVGPGMSIGFDAALLRVIPVFRGNPLPIDTTTWMDLQNGGVSDEVIRRPLRNCRVDIWLIPKGSPFVAISAYTNEDVFSPAVIEEFEADYERIGSGALFDQWRCKRHGS